MKTMFDTQKRAGFIFSFAKMPKSRINEILRQNWSGKIFSERIWDREKNINQTLKNELLVSFMTGRSYNKTAKEIENKMASSAYAARRLVRTESAYISNMADMESYKAAGIEKYKFLATLDLRTSDICQSMDGKVFKVSEALCGTNLPPMHTYCRSTTVSFADDKAKKNMKKRIARNPETGKVYYVDENMTYAQWEKTIEKIEVEENIKNVDKSGKSDIINLNRSAKRREKNIGMFKNLTIPMQKRTILRVAKKYGIETQGLTFKIQRSEKLLSLPFYGSTDYNNIGRIDIFPNAFLNEEQLIRTIIHEKCHVKQLKKYGRKYTQNNVERMEKLAERFEEIYYCILKKRVK